MRTKYEIMLENLRNRINLVADKRIEEIRKESKKK